MAEIIQRTTGKTAVLTTGLNQEIIPAFKLRGNQFDWLGTAVVGGTGSWTFAIFEMEFSIDNGVTWLTGDVDLGNYTVTQDFNLAVTVTRGTMFRVLAQLAEAAPTPTIQLDWEIIVV